MHQACCLLVKLISQKNRSTGVRKELSFGHPCHARAASFLGHHPPTLCCCSRTATFRALMVVAQVLATGEVFRTGYLAGSCLDSPLRASISLPLCPLMPACLLCAAHVMLGQRIAVCVAATLSVHSRAACTSCDQGQQGQRGKQDTWQGRAQCMQTC
jgi:hypothetical protein